MTDPATKKFKVYQASAGSGKTYTIVKEYLGCCLHDESSTDNFRHILAITFTNMAANEMKDKIIQHLNDIINSDPSLPEKGMEKDLVKELNIKRSELKTNAAILFQKILHDYSSFNVCTIDNFVQKLARPFAKELQLPNNYTVSIDQTDVADAITEQIGEKIGLSSPFLTKVLEDYNNRMLDDEKKEKIYNLINDELYVPMKEKEIAALLDIKKEERANLSRALSELCEAGKIQKTLKGKYIKKYWHCCCRQRRSSRR